MLFLSSLECEYLLAKHYHRGSFLARIFPIFIFCTHRLSMQKYFMEIFRLDK